MNPDHTSSLSLHARPDRRHHNWLYRRFALPLFALLRMGTSPQKLAWSIAVGLVIGINPILGSTTILCLVVAFLFRLNIPASQLGNHIVYPLQFLFLLPFLHLGTRVFHTEPLTLSANALLKDARRHPVELAHRLWMWEWHAFLLWIALAAVLTPLLALALTPVLKRLLSRIHHHKYPILSRK